MPSTGRRDLVANRWEPFVHVIRWEGFDFTGATFQLQVRAVRDAPGAPLVDLVTVGSIATEGVRLTDFETVNGVPVSTLSIRMNEPTVEGLPGAHILGDDAKLFWDMQITPSGGVKYRALEGTFTVKAGVTQ